MSQTGRGAGLWSQAESLAWVIYGPQRRDNLPKLITLHSVLLSVLQEQQSTSGLTPQAGKDWIAREIVSLMPRGLFILFCSKHQHRQEAAPGKGPCVVCLCQRLLHYEALRMLLSAGLCQKEIAVCPRLRELQLRARPGLQRAESSSN